MMLTMKGEGPQELDVHFKGNVWSGVILKLCLALGC